MKKTLCLTALILTSVSAYAVECIKPKECTLWAHQMCTASQKFLGDDEYMEVTPKSIRIRKIILDATQRLRQRGKIMRGEI